MKAGLMSSSGRIFARGYMGMSSMVLQGVYTFHVWRVVQGSQTINFITGVHVLVVFVVAGNTLMSQNTCIQNI